MKEVTIYCDGSGMTDKTPCGFAAILIYNGNRKEIAGSLDNGTNNVAELMAAIIALEALKERCKVSVHSDSEYVVLGMREGRAKRARAQGWFNRKLDPGVETKWPEIAKKWKTPNWSLWERLLNASAQHEVTFHWVRGHDGHPENSRCDKLAGEARRNHQTNDTRIAN